MSRLLLFATILVLPMFGQQRDRRVEPIVAHRQVALVIGNSAYTNQLLKNPVNDAQAMGRCLRELNYDVAVVTDARYKAMGQAIDNFLDKLKTGDVAFFYYSGHGMQMEGENYLIPVDFRGQSETDVRNQAHAAGRIQERMEKSGAQLNILIMDACRTNPFRATSRSGTQGLAAMRGGRGTIIAFATAPGRTASDDTNGQNGLFTQYLLEALATPGLGLDDVFNLVRVRVDQASGGKQLPWTSSNVTGRYSFAPDGAPPAAMNPPSSPEPFLEILLSYVSDAARGFASRPGGSKWTPERQLPGARCVGNKSNSRSDGRIVCEFVSGSYDQLKRQIQRILPEWGPPEKSWLRGPAGSRPREVTLGQWHPVSRVDVSISKALDAGPLVLQVAGKE